MAGRGGPKLKEFRMPITSLKHWQSEVSFPGLSIVEIYSSSFGSCQVILPLINAIMMSTDKADSSIKWLTVNVGKIEEEARGALEEEAKKVADMQSQINSKRMSIQSSNSPNNQAAEESKEADDDVKDESGEEKTSEGDDQSSNAPAAQSADKHLKRKTTPVITLPGLEAYAGYDHPRPLWLFFVNGEMRYELTSCNPPKLSKLVAACLTGTQLSEAELSNMELASDSKEVSEEKKRKRKLAKMLQEQEAAKLKMQQDAEARKKKREITRDPEYLINMSIEQFSDAVRAEILKLEDNAGADRRVCVVLACRETEADDYVYHSQTPALIVDQATKSIVFPASLVMKKLENAELQANTELKVAIFDTADDEPIRGDRAVEIENGCLGEVYVKVGAILSGEIKQLHFVFTDRSLPPLSPSATKSPRGVAKADLKIATLNLNVYERPSEGVCTDYRFNFNVDIDGLPAQPEAAPVKELVEGEEAQPEAVVEPPVIAPSSWNFRVSILDAAAPVSINQLVQNVPTRPTEFSLMVMHYARMERTLKFTVTDGDRSIGEVSMLFSALLTARSSASGHVVDLVFVNSNGEPVSNVKAVLRIDEIDGEGNVVEIEGEEQSENVSTEEAVEAVDPEAVRVSMTVNDAGIVQVKLRLLSSVDEPVDQPIEEASQPADALAVSIKEVKSTKASPRQPLSPQHLSPKSMSPKLGANSKPASKQATPRTSVSKPVSKAASKVNTPRVEYTTSKSTSKAATPRLEPSKPASKAATPRVSLSTTATPRSASNSLSKPASKAVTPREPVDAKPASKPASKTATPRVEASEVEQSSSSKVATPRVEEANQSEVEVSKPASKPVSKVSTPRVESDEPVVEAAQSELPVTPATEPAAAEDIVAVNASKPASTVVTPRVEQSVSKPASKSASQAATPRVEQSVSKPVSKPASQAATPRVEAASASKPPSKPASQSATPRVEQTEEVTANSSKPVSKPASKAATPRTESVEAAQEDNYEDDSHPLVDESEPVADAGDAYEDEFVAPAESVVEPTEAAVSKPASKAPSKSVSAAATPRTESVNQSQTKSASHAATPRVEAVSSESDAPSATPRVHVAADVREDGSVALTIDMQ